MKKELLVPMINEGLESMLSDIYEAEHIQSGDFSPAQTVKWDKLVVQLTDLFAEVIEQNKQSRYIIKNSNIAENLINTGGNCMVLERIVLTDDDEILYCALSDEYFTINTQSIKIEEFVPDKHQIFAWELKYLNCAARPMIADNTSYRQCSLAGFKRIFYEMSETYANRNKKK